MIISLNWLKKYVDINIPTNELVELIGSRLVEVEETIDLGEKYRGIKIVEVKSVEKIEDSDHLTKCLVWDGETETQVVCGAPNVRAKMLAVWLPPKTVLPATFSEEPLVLDRRKIRGIESAGMLAAMDELDFGSDHSEIVEIDPAMAKPGDDFAEIFGLNDTLFNIENKSLTHRPDCFGVIGFAREIAGILGQPAGDFLNHPDKNNSFKDLQFGNDVKPRVTIEDTKLCSRYQAVVLDDFKEKPAKYLSEMSVLLVKSGMRPISPIVDVLNYLMLLSGQPLHAFDYDKLLAAGGGEEAHIIVRTAKKGEKLELLDGKTIEMDSSDIVVTSNNIPIALAGAMGGESTKVDEKTRRIGIESATFSMYNLRATQFRHGIFSEAITRFTKGQPLGLTDPVLRETVRILTNEHGMQAVSEIIDSYPEKIKNQPIEISAKRVNELLGSNYSYGKIEKTLQNVGFEINCNCGKSGKCDCEFVNVTAPWWRTDIHIAEDIIEEVGRLNGFDNIPAILPQRSFTAPAPDKLGNLKSKIRQILSSAGANEVLTYSFVSEKLLASAGQNPKNSYKIINSISPELQYIRQALVPNLLEKAQENYKDGYDEFALFEINQVFIQDEGLTNEKVPKQFDDLALVMFDYEPDKTSYYSVKKYVEKLAAGCGVKLEFQKAELYSDELYFEPKRSAEIFMNGSRIGVIGEIKQSIARNFKIPTGARASALMINLDEALDKLNDDIQLEKSSKFPSVERDMTFQVNSDLEYAKLENLICENLTKRGLWFELVPVSIYQGDDKSTKNISFKLTFADHDKTLNGDEIATIIDEIADEVTKQFNATIV
ncbi:MAG: phenylalanine--tRNA ligase subunit beta [Candidatus Nomurabacteria bacterium]|nr:phenylalanine--tRNA ligase subunit beta [Candidatus Nomurabacteria bacterium]